MENAQQNPSNEDQLVILDTLVKFKDLHKEYNKNRTRSFIEEWSIGKNKQLIKEHPEISLERTDSVNIRTFCAHGTKAWALFSACAFANGQLLPENEIKLTGMFAASGEIKGKDVTGKNCVSTAPLSAFNGKLEGPMLFAHGGDKTMKNDNYEDLKKAFLKKYNKKSKSDDVKKEIQSLFDANMGEAYKKLSNIATVIIGDGIGEYIDNPFGKKASGNIETLYKRVNIRAIAIDGEDNKDFVQILIQSIAPELAKTIALFTIQEIKEFEKKREKYDDYSYLNLFTCDFIDSYNSRLPFKFSSNKVKEIENKEVILYKRFFSEKTIRKYGYSEVLCKQTKTRAIEIITGANNKEELAIRELIQSANPELKKTTAIFTSEEIEKYGDSNDTYDADTHKMLSARFMVDAKEIPIKYYVEGLVDGLEDINSKKAILDNFQKAHEHYNKAIQYKSCDKKYCRDFYNAEDYHAEAMLGLYSSSDKNDADLIKSFEDVNQSRLNVGKELNEILSKEEQKEKVQTVVEVKNSSISQPIETSSLSKPLVQCAAVQQLKNMNKTTVSQQTKLGNQNAPKLTPTTEPAQHTTTSP